MRKTIEILGIPVDVIDHDGALDNIEQFMDEGGYHLIITPNPEMIMLAQKNARIREILRSSALAAPDGVGVIWASRLTDSPIPHRVTGCDLMIDLLGRMSKSGRAAYLLGGRPGVAEQAKRNMESRFPGVKIIGARHGYFTADDDRLITEELNDKKPDLLLLGLSMGTALNWAHNHRALNIPVIACVGGTLDIMGGATARAPKIFQKLGLEWLYRLIRQPWRVGRMLRLPVFAAMVVRESLSRRK
ncbi:MAG: WecB/TagA/CpsF family glycosyltransferase [Clostridiales bacterium]|jgi:N-acetylglucosaminyldiphosphoundecaprenol N-acetyl-beta-D-mannosaminyltransferase|nr:WecB/TagA/CpsF family glycosyltransferase [Clostridiales bacterium]